LNLIRMRHYTNNPEKRVLQSIGDASSFLLSWAHELQLASNAEAEAADKHRCRPHSHALHLHPPYRGRRPPRLSCLYRSSAWFCGGVEGWQLVGVFRRKCATSTTAFLFVARTVDTGCDGLTAGCRCRCCSSSKIELQRPAHAPLQRTVAESPLSPSPHCVIRR
jgi:hypothetical protein